MDDIVIRLLNKGEDIKGSYSYQILVGKQHICKFEDNHLDGLANCLQKAAEAVELHEWCDFVFLDEVKGG